MKWEASGRKFITGFQLGVMIDGHEEIVQKNLVFV